jgi:predicted RNA methylase
MSEQLLLHKATWWGTAQEHIARYLFAARFVANKVVLDAACGSGYGSAYLRHSGAKQVVGVDLCAEALER